MTFQHAPDQARFLLTMGTSAASSTGGTSPARQAMGFSWNQMILKPVALTVNMKSAIQLGAPVLHIQMPAVWVKDPATFL